MNNAHALFGHSERMLPCDRRPRSKASRVEGEEEIEQQARS